MSCVRASVRSVGLVYAECRPSVRSVVVGCAELHLACVEETGKTKMAKAVWVFVAGALLNSERSRPILSVCKHIV